MTLTFWCSWRQAASSNFKLLQHHRKHRPNDKVFAITTKLKGVYIVIIMPTVAFATDADTQLKTPSTSQRDSSHGSTGSGTSASASAKSPTLRANLTRQHAGRDPLDFYDVQKILGTGSMGTVSTVRKKKHKVGLSARYNIEARQQAQEKIDACFNFPIFGPIFRYFLKDKANTMLEEASLSHHHLKSDDGTSATGATSFSSSSSSSMVYAMKSIHLHCVKDPTFVNELKNEIEVLKTLDHPHIIKIFETFDYNKQIFVVMELCSGGDLYSRDPYTEEDAARITSGILSAVAYMHSKGVLHRDLKYENILFTDGSPKAPIKLIDFGLSREVMEHEKLTDLAGTIYTMAPEVIQGQYGKPADLWSVGVIAYMLMSSQMPFYGTKRREVVNRILVGKYDYKGRRWKRISEQGKAFVEDLLVLDPDDRSTADEALRASWLHRRHAATVRNPQEGELENVRRSLKRYVRYPKLRRLALMVIAHKSTTDEIGILRKVFQHYDTDRSGALNYETFVQILNEAGFSEDEYRDVFDAVNMDGSGFIRYTEFLAATIEAVGWISEERLAEAFDRVDHDNTGYITKGNLQYLFGDDFPVEEIDLLMTEAGSRNGRGISFVDFMAQWNDDKEEFEREWRKHMFEEVIVNDSKDLNKSDDVISEISFNVDSDTDSDPARVNFIDGKTLSIRKKLDFDAELKTPASSEDLRKVVIEEDAIVTSTLE